jgi:hypothetical protein
MRKNQAKALELIAEVKARWASPERIAEILAAPERLRTSGLMSAGAVVALALLCPMAAPGALAVALRSGQIGYNVATAEEAARVAAEEITKLAAQLDQLAGLIGSDQ